MAIDTPLIYFEAALLFFPSSSIDSTSATPPTLTRSTEKPYLSQSQNFSNPVSSSYMGLTSSNNNNIDQSNVLSSSANNHLAAGSAPLAMPASGPSLVTTLNINHIQSYSTSLIPTTTTPETTPDNINMLYPHIVNLLQLPQQSNHPQVVASRGDHNLPIQTSPNYPPNLDNHINNHEINNPFRIRQIINNNAIRVTSFNPTNLNPPGGLESGSFSRSHPIGYRGLERDFRQNRGEGRGEYDEPFRNLQHSNGEDDDDDEDDEMNDNDNDNAENDEGEDDNDDDDDEEEEDDDDDDDDDDEEEEEDDDDDDDDEEEEEEEDDDNENSDDNHESLDQLETDCLLVKPSNAVLISPSLIYRTHPDLTNAKLPKYLRETFYDDLPSQWSRASILRGKMYQELKQYMTTGNMADVPTLDKTVNSPISQFLPTTFDINESGQRPKKTAKTPPSLRTLGGLEIKYDPAEPCSPIINYPNHTNRPKKKNNKNKTTSHNVNNNNYNISQYLTTLSSNLPIPTRTGIYYVEFTILHKESIDHPRDYPRVEDGPEYVESAIGDIYIGGYSDSECDVEVGKETNKGIGLSSQNSTARCESPARLIPGMVSGSWALNLTTGKFFHNGHHIFMKHITKNNDLYDASDALFNPMPKMNFEAGDILGVSIDFTNSLITFHKKSPHVLKAPVLEAQPVKMGVKWGGKLWLDEPTPDKSDDPGSNQWLWIGMGPGTIVKVNFGYDKSHPFQLDIDDRVMASKRAMYKQIQLNGNNDTVVERRDTILGMIQEYMTVNGFVNSRVAFAHDLVNDNEEIPRDLVKSKLDIGEDMDLDIDTSMDPDLGGIPYSRIRARQDIVNNILAGNFERATQNISKSFDLSSLTDISTYKYLNTPYLCRFIMAYHNLQLRYLIEMITTACDGPDLHQAVIFGKSLRRQYRRLPLQICRPVIIELTRKLSMISTLLVASPKPSIDKMDLDNREADSKSRYADTVTGIKFTWVSEKESFCIISNKNIDIMPELKLAHLAEEFEQVLPLLDYSGPPKTKLEWLAKKVILNIDLLGGGVTAQDLVQESDVENNSLKRAPFRGIGDIGYISMQRDCLSSGIYLPRDVSSLFSTHDEDKYDSDDPCHWL